MSDCVLDASALLALFNGEEGADGDRACLALALTTATTAVTADRAWQDLHIGVNIKLIR